MILKCEDIGMSFGTRTLFEHVNLQINEGQKWGLVGPNGAGKTTLLKIISHEISPDEGVVSFAKDTKLGYLSQVAEAPSERTLLDEVLTSCTELQEIDTRMTHLHELVSLEKDESAIDKMLEEIASLQERFELLDGYTLTARAETILAGLGFSETDFHRLATAFSGGWVMRMRLAKLLLQKPTILLLDEPTNHLDLVSVKWLEKYISTYSGALFLVSHDRAFMNNTVDHIASLENRTITTYKGNYGCYIKLREENLEQLRLKRAAQERDIAHMQTFVNKFRYKATKAKAAQERLARIEKIKSELVELPESHKEITFSFPEPPRTSDPLVELKDVSKAYGELEVYKDVNMKLYRGERVALVGQNGAGKSTLLKLVAKKLSPTSGDVLWGNHVSCSYYAQHQLDAINPLATPFTEIAEVTSGWTTTEIRKLLGSFLFSGDDCSKKNAVLSGGEMARLALAKMLVLPNALLCLDEPTNHLDIASVGVLERALLTFQGTILLVSHDEELVQKLATKVIEVVPGKLLVYDGDYRYYLSKKAAEEGEGVSYPSASELLSTQVVKPKPASARKTKAQKRAEAELRNKLYRVNKETQHELKHIEDELGKKQARYNELVQLMADPTFYEDKQQFECAMVEYGSLKTMIEELEASWLEIQERLEQDTKEA